MSPEDKVVSFPPRPAPGPPVKLAPVVRPSVAPVDRPPGVDLTGRRKVLFFIGRGRVGKTHLVRWAAETAAEQGGDFIVSAAAPTNRALVYLDDVAQPLTTDPIEVRDWLLSLF